MKQQLFKIESPKRFSESLIWQLNRRYYQQVGIDAWRSGDVPHHLTSNSFVGKTYAKLIFGFLNDLAKKGQTEDQVYILELGAGHGRLAFHTLKHLEQLIKFSDQKMPKYCYVISDIVEENLNFFQNHPQFQSYLENGQLDVAYFDGVKSKEILLRNANRTIMPNDLKQPLLVVANYFFDSISTDLFYIKDKQIAACHVALGTEDDPSEMNVEALLKNIEVDFSLAQLQMPCYEENVLNEILDEYRQLVSHTYLFFPHQALKCIQNLHQLSPKGLMILSMDKGYHEIHDLDNNKPPEMIAHGSFSIWVNFHALGEYCKRQGGISFFPTFSTFNAELGCLLMLPESETYSFVKQAYQSTVNEFGPDDFNNLKNFTYKNIATMSLQGLISFLRSSAYDSKVFINVLPRLKQVSQQITYKERKRIAQVMHKTWNMYFTLNGTTDMAFEIGGMFYSLGFYQEALDYFKYSVAEFGDTADVFYNRALCHYHLRQDELFLEILKEAKTAFPDYKLFAYLDTLDLNAK